MTMRRFDAIVLDVLWDGEWKSPQTISICIGVKRRSYSNWWTGIGTWLGPHFTEPKIERVCDALQRLQRSKLVYLQPAFGKGADILSAMIATGPIDSEAVLRAAQTAINSQPNSLGNASAIVGMG
jgi:hypothetical protein